VSINTVTSPSKDSSPTLTGNAGSAAGDHETVSVKIYPGSSAAGTPAASASVSAAGGKWSYTPSSLADGTYTAQVTQLDDAGNKGEGEAVTFVIDSAGPNVSINTVGSPTKDSTPKLEGNAGTATGDSATVTVTIYRGGSVGGTVEESANVTASGGKWSYTSPTLGDGTYTAQATQKDNGGNTGTSSAATFIVDTTAPKVAINPVTSPTKDSSPTLKGNAGTAPGDHESVSVKIYRGSSPEGSVAASASVSGASGTWSYTPSSLADGTYTAQATQTDEAGNTGEGEAVTFVIDSAGPNVSINSVGSPTKDSTPKLEGNAGTATGDSATVTVTIYRGGSVGGTVEESANVTESSGKWTHTPATLGDGTYTAQATQKDNGGNTGTSSAVTFAVDTTAPSVSLNTITSPTGDSTPTLGGNGGTASGDDNTVTVRIFSGETQVASGEPSISSGHWSFTSPHLADGTYTAKATQSDQAGNPGSSVTRTFTVETASPTVTLKQPPSPSNDTTPSFTGTATDTETVTVHVYKGSKAEGTQVSSATAEGTGGGWSSGQASPGLTSGQYTAVATQPSSLGNSDGRSNTVTFTVSTASPTVTLNAVESLSNHTTPSFSGSASDTETVTVHIYKGSKAEGIQVSSATAEGTGGGWSSGQASPALVSGQYTAIATQPSSLGNPAGKSSSVTFSVSTASPNVTLSQPESPSKDTTPSFSGTASDTETVTVHIYKGSKAEGTQVASAHASGTGGGWTSGQASPALGSGQYTAVATQPSSLGNPDGTSSSVTFEVDTAAPTVTLNQPTSPSNHTTPSFTGTASDTTTVTVKIYAGSKATGSPVSSATAKGNGGSWSSGNASPALSSGEYTAVATQPSSLGNPDGKSDPVSFEVSTASPTVTLNPIESPSNHTTPSFSGFGSDKTQVTITIFKGTHAEGTEVSKATATGNGGEWSSGQASPALTNGQYTAVATQTSSLGNAAGVSNTITFTINTSPPTVSLNQPKTPSNNTTPSFTGSASDIEPVTVRIYAGSKAEGTEVSKAAATGTGSGWSSGPASTALTSGEYTAIAEQPSSLGNAPGKSTSVKFVVDTSSPTVTLSPVTAVSKNTTPSFKGTASATTSVVVHIFEGTAAEGTEVSKATASGTGGGWSSGSASPALSTGVHTYTAVATQESPLGNPAGRSSAVTFVVNTTAPTVILNSLPARSNNTTPLFTGTATDTEQVTLRVYKGTKAEGTPTVTLTAAVTGGSWQAQTVTPLANGEYVARATQQSSLGNPEGVSNSVPFAINNLAPNVTIDQPKSPSNDTAPSFSGTATDTEPVTVRVYKGAKAEGTAVATLSAEVIGEAWKSPSVSTVLVSGEYTAAANQKSSFGNTEGISNAVKFVVNTSPPTVILNSLPARSNNTTPVFVGTASDTEPIVVHIYEEPKVGERKEVAQATAPGTGGPWTSGATTPALAGGIHKYIAIATQKSSLGNPEGKSASITFEVDTTSPTVTITSPANASASNDVTPEFSGTSSGTQASSAISITIYEGTPAEGRNVSSAKATVAAGKWTSSPASPALATGDHIYTAVATEASLLGNPPGTSEVTFRVNTEPPTVALNPLPSPSNSRTPEFEGTATDTTQVTVRVYEGKKPEGKEVSSVQATPVAGAWKAPPASLPTGKHTYTAIAIQESSLGNPSGKSGAVTFIVDPEAPTVTLNSPPVLSNSTTPSFTGTASNNTPVTVTIYQGSKAEGAPVATATASGTGAGWASGKAGPPLSNGQYTAKAEQSSLVGGHVGNSKEVTFTIDTIAPQPALTEPESGSSTNGESQLVRGTASTASHDIPRVTVQLFSGAAIGEGQGPVQAIEVGASSGAWSTTFAGLTPGTYTLRAEQHDEAGNVGASCARTPARSTGRILLVVPVESACR
jgi:major membrane immunogen (membrane-anchored lipoprotein)